jgi:Xaa-Pro aminopeptidase
MSVKTKGDRAGRLEPVLDEAQLDLLLVSELVAVRYLTGYTGSNGLVLIGPDTRVFVTDFRYVEQAAEEVDPSFERVRAPQDLVEELPRLLEARDGVRLGFDDAHVSVRGHARLHELLGDGVELVPARGLVEGRRRIKEPGEVERIAEACRLADEAFEALIGSGIVGRSERELALALEWEMRSRGAEAISFEPIVASGAGGALPHAHPREVAVERGQLVTFDWGCRLDGYCSDCTRTLATGAPGTLGAEQVEAYELVLRAQLRGLEVVRAGGHGRAIDAEVRAIINEAGHEEHYGHGLGHGVGLEVHEAPRLSTRSEDTLEAGNVVSVEPGIYVPGRFGIRIEDLVVVTQDGCRILTGLPKELRVVD